MQSLALMEASRTTSSNLVVLCTTVNRYKNPKSGAAGLQNQRGCERSESFWQCKQERVEAETKDCPQPALYLVASLWGGGVGGGGGGQCPPETISLFKSN